MSTEPRTTGLAAAKAAEVTELQSIELHELDHVTGGGAAGDILGALGKGALSGALQGAAQGASGGGLGNGGVLRGALAGALQGLAGTGASLIQGGGQGGQGGAAPQPQQ